jgi:1,4-dihydroxy-2-naphthoate octaprenyltransferase
MGGLITLASYTALTGAFSWKPLIASIPVMIGIALIMFTNNTCDIEKDRKAGRATLAVSLGRKDAIALYRLLLAAWVVLIALMVVIYYPTGSLILFFVLAAWPSILGLLRNPFVHRSRAAGMSAITAANASLGLVYGAAILLSAVVVIVA